MQPALVRNYDELVEAMRARASELSLTGEQIDAIAGLCDRYVVELSAPGRPRVFGPVSFDTILGALGLQILVNWRRAFEERGYSYGWGRQVVRCSGGALVGGGPPEPFRAPVNEADLHKHYDCTVSLPAPKEARKTAQLLAEPIAVSAQCTPHDSKRGRLPVAREFLKVSTWGTTTFSAKVGLGET
jgi:hypothetical protein